MYRRDRHRQGRSSWLISNSDTGGHVSINGERSDAECVGARFIAPWGLGGLPAIDFATSINSG